MSGTKLNGKTIGEVEKLTGIPKRKLKYMIERDLIHPSQRSESGFWLYREEDIQAARTVILFQQLGYPEKDIRILLSAPVSQWSKDLERQIIQLTEKRNRIEDQLFLAELLLHQEHIHTDASEFPSTAGNIPSAWAPGEKEALCRFLCQMFSEAGPGTPLHELSRLTDRPPDAPIVQEQIQGSCGLSRHRSSMSPAQLLLILRLAHTLSGLVPVLDALLGTEGAVQFITAAMQYYCEHQEPSLQLPAIDKEIKNERI